MTSLTTSSLTTGSRTMRHVVRSTGVLAVSVLLTAGVLALMSSLVEPGA